MKRIFITGAAGFIGAHLAHHLIARGDEVLGFDNFNEYYDSRLKVYRVNALCSCPVIKGDLSDHELLTKTIADFKPTHVVHLAAQAGVRYSLENPHAYIKSNLEGFLNVLELCRRHPSVKLIYASSSSVYGLNEKVPFSEVDRTDRQASFYGVTKKTNELMASTYHHLYGISVTGLRFFTVYGPWGRPDMAYFSFAKKIVEGKPIQVFNHGAMMRDFTYIDDIIAGTTAAIDLGAANEIFNLGHHHPVKLGKFIQILEEALGRKAIIEELGMQKGDVEKTYADIEHSGSQLAFDPKISLEVGIPKFVSWFKDYYSKLGLD
jgi:UDP-glucuronate 4-epimerase